MKAARPSRATPIGAPDAKWRHLSEGIARPSKHGVVERSEAAVGYLPGRMSDRPETALLDRLAVALAAARAALERRARAIDDLNVFPVADGDTGANMLVTVRAVERAARDAPDAPGRRGATHWRARPCSPRRATAG